MKQRWLRGPDGCRPLLPVLLASLFLFGHLSASFAQEHTLNVPFQAPFDSGPGDLTVNPFCDGITWSDNPSEYLSITINMLSAGQSLGANSSWGLGSAYTSVQGTTSIGRTARLVECYLYTNWGGWDHGQINYPARVPTSLVTDLDQFSYYGLGNYERLRHYGAVDNYNHRYRYAGTPVNEAYVINSNGCNFMEIQTASSTLNSNGAFEDRYTTFGQSIPECSVNPSCVTDSTQTLWVDSQPFYKSVVWSCSNVSVTP